MAYLWHIYMVFVKKELADYQLSLGAFVRFRVSEVTHYQNITTFELTYSSLGKINVKLEIKILTLPQFW